MKTPGQLRKLAKKKAQWKDYRKRRNIIKQEIREVENGKRSSFSVEFPGKKKYATELLKRHLEKTRA